MARNAYMKKLQANWEQLQADWKKSNADVKEDMADESIKRQMDELRNDFKSAGNLADAKLDELGNKLEVRMAQLRQKMNS